MAAPLLALEGITHSFRRSGRSARRGGARREPQGAPRGNGRARRRIGFGQIDAWTHRARLASPDAGRVLIGGKSLGDMSSRELRRERVAFQPIFQDATASLNPRRTVRESVGPGIAATGRRRERVHKRRAP